MAETSDKSFYILDDGKTAGPFSLAQLRAMRGSGAVTLSTAVYSAELRGWRTLEAIAPQLDADPEPAAVAQNGPHNYSSETAAILLQAKMKSTVAAAILAILFPFFGCFYSAPLYGLNCLIVAATILSTSIQFARLNMPVEVFFCQVALGLPYLASIFYAVKGVQEFNERLAEKLSGIKLIIELPTSKFERAFGHVLGTAVLLGLLWCSTNLKVVQGLAKEAKLDVKYRTGEQR